MSTEEQIEEILAEASAYGLRIEVEASAKKLIEEDPSIDKVLAYEHGYNDWIK